MTGPFIGGGGGGGGGTVTSSGLTPNIFPVATAAQNIEDSHLRQDASGLNAFFTGAGFNVGGAGADASAALQADSTSKGLLIPRLTVAQRLLIVAPATGLMIYQTDGVAGFFYWTGAAWLRISTAGAGTVTSSGLTSFAIPRATGAQNIENSNLITDAADTLLLWKGTQMVINNTTIDASAALQIDSTSKGVLVPRMTNAQRVAIAAPSTALLVYCTDVVAGFYVFDGGVWVFMGAGDVTSSGMTAGKVAGATAAQNIENTGLSFVGDRWTFGGPSNVGIGQIQGVGAAPVVTAGPGAGGAGSSVTLTGTDLGGNVVVVFGALPAVNALLFSVAFNMAYTTAPRCVIVIRAGGGLAANSQPFLDAASITVNGFDVRSGLALSGTHTFFYAVIQ